MESVKKVINGKYGQSLYKLETDYQKKYILRKSVFG